MFDAVLRTLILLITSGWFIWWWFLAKKDTNQKMQYMGLVTKYANFLLQALIFFQLLGLRLFSFQNALLSLMGFILVLIGVWVSVAGRLALGSNWVPGYQAKKSDELVTKGIYGIIRHPIYIGIFCIFVGSELVAGSWLWISFLFLLFPLYFLGKREEMLLQEKFGKTYFLYKKKTTMFFPFLF